MSQHKNPIRTATYTITATCLSDLALVEYTSKAVVKDGKNLIVQVGALVALVLYLVLPQWPPSRQPDQHGWPPCELRLRHRTVPPFNNRSSPERIFDGPFGL